MKCMGVLEEWLKSLLAKATRDHHLRGMRRFIKFMEMTPETILKKRRAQFGKSKLMETKATEGRES